MKALIALGILATAIQIDSDQQSKLSEETQVAGLVCFKESEQVSGRNKICNYDCSGSTVAITIGSQEFCPMSIER